MNWARGGSGQDDILEPVETDPSSPAEGEMAFNSTDKAVKIYYDGVWYTLHTLGIPDEILLESGEVILLESDSKVLTEG